MRSSGSTHNPRSDRRVSLWLLVAGEDHPKICTGRRLLRRHLVLPLSSERPPRHAPLLLDPHADVPLGPGDRPRALEGGILGVDCSWNRLEERGGYPEAARWLKKVRTRRRLPWLVAANPQHFGRLGELNTAEAFAAALWLVGERDRALSLIEAFPGGATFLRINKARFEAYADAPTPESLQIAEAQQFP